MSGKGSRQRQSQIPDKKLKQNWDRIFKESPKRLIQENNYGKTNKIQQKDIREGRGIPI